MAPKSSKLKKECFRCGLFNPEARGYYKCACKGSCPGLDWTKTTKESVLLTHHLRTDTGGTK